MAQLIMFGSGIVAGSQLFDIAGSDTFIVPRFRTLTVTLYGAGSGGNGQSSGTNIAGTAGGDTTWNSGSVTAGGGQPGASGASYTGGAGGTASGGDTNTTGGAGSGGFGISDGKGGDAPAPDGGAGGATTTFIGTDGNAGNAPGGGGGGTQRSSGNYAPGGGAGAKSVKTYSHGDLVVGASVSLVVGAGGPGGVATETGGAGADGAVRIEWS